MTDNINQIPLQSASEDIWDKKYRLKDKDEKIVDKNIDDTYKRVARAMADIESEENREKWYKKFLWVLRRGAIPAGRITSNAGAQKYKPATSLINCTVSETIEDSMNGIMRACHQAALTLKSGAGIGYEFSTLRPRNAFVSGAGAHTSGPMSFMDIFDKMCFTVSSAGGRRGAQMGTFDVSHPDVRDFIKAKREDGVLRQFNLSLLISDEFMHAVENDLPWNLIFPVNKKEDSDIDLNDTSKVVWREWPIHDGYIVNDEGLVACKIYGVVQAKNLWDMIMVSTYDYAEPGFILIDKVNEMNNNWWCENLRATNPCVTADTWVQTGDGPRQVADLLGTPFFARVDGVDHMSGSEGFFRTATKDVVRLQATEGHSLRLTSDHRVRRVTRHTRWSTDTEWCEAGKLVPGDRVLLNNHRSGAQWQGTGSHEEGFLLGMLVGDGTLNRKSAVLSVWSQEAVVNGEETLPIALMDETLRCARTLAHRADFTGWNEVAGRSEHRMELASLRNLAFEMGMRPGHKDITKTMEKTSSDFHCGFLRGMFDSDGSVQGSQTKGVSVRLSQSDMPRLQAVQRMLLRLGIASTIYRDRRVAGESLLPDGHGGMRFYSTQAQHELIVSGDNLTAFAKLIGFADSAKTNRLKAALSSYKRRLNRERFLATVESVTPDGQEDVFDVQVPGINTFDANGLHAHNCGEQSLPPEGSCWTGSMRIQTNLGLLRTDEAYQRSLKGEEIEIAVDSRFTKSKTELRPARIVENGIREVIEMRLDNGQFLEVTGDHRIHTPNGWVEAQNLKAGDDVSIQNVELNDRKLISDFDAGALNYILDGYDSENILVCKESKRLALEPILTRLCVNHNVYIKNGSTLLSVSRNHDVVREALAIDWQNENKVTKEHMEGYSWAAQQTAAKYKKHLAVYGKGEFCDNLAKIWTNITGIETRKILHGKNTYRVILRGEAIKFKPQKPKTLSMKSALAGWMLCDGWAAKSTGILFNTEDDIAEKLLHPEFVKATGTGGKLSTCYTGISTSVKSISCYKKSGVEKIYDLLGIKEPTYSKDIRVPEFIYSANKDEQASFIAAAFGADGSIEKNRGLIRLTSASRKFLEDVQLLLIGFGIHTIISSGISKGNIFYNLSIKKSENYRFYTFIGFPFNSKKQEILEKHLREKCGWRAKENNFVSKVVTIRRAGNQVVYDMEEPTTNTLIVNGIVIHNCLLGSVNLTRFVKKPFTDEAYFDFKEYKKVVGVFTRLLDNVVEINGLPLEGQRREIEQKRRHGMGFLGLGSTLTMLKIPYGTPESVEFTDNVTRELAVEGWRQALELAKEKGPAPILAQEFEVNAEMLRKRPEMKRDGWKVGDKIKGAELHARYSRYMQQIAEVEPELVEELAKVGARFTHHSSIAPTGTISLSLANNASNGIEPSFGHHYSRNIIRDGKKSKEKVDVFSFELLAYRELVNNKAMPYSEKEDEKLPNYFVVADDISPKQHVDIQAAAQKWIDSSISKTANVPTDYPFEDFKDIYLYAYRMGLKGCTTFRYNPEVFQGVLVKDSDLENTTYQFTLEDGSVMELKGNEMVEYDGEVHNAANLFDALKEGYYGKY